MTLKYESEILFDLMKRDGDATPSDVLPYESELKEKYLNQVVGAYPKLQDYQSEWLNYNLYYQPPSDFPVESVSNVTSASFHHVVPYAYESAILKGQTLVNIAYIKHRAYNYTDYNLSFIDKTKTYFIKFNATFETKRLGFLVTVSTWNVVKDLKATKNGYVIIKPDEAKDVSSLRVRFDDNTDKSFIPTLDLICIEYQDGMENWDIPYFEGMQSVKMPVLTTTGKNLLNPTLVERTYPSVATGDNVPFNKIDSPTGSHTSINMFNCEYGKTYTVSVISGNADRRQVFELDENNNVLTRASGKSTYTVTNTNTRTLYWYLGQDSTNIIPLDGVQLEEGSTATSYEPYKSNILTVNEDDELRGIGDVKDTLDCLTGELTQRIGEIVLDGSDDEEWRLNWGESENYIGFQLTANTSNVKGYTLNQVSNLLPRTDYAALGGKDYEWFVLTHINTFNLKIAKNKLISSNVDGLKRYLAINPLIVQYQLAEKTIKTVDLSCINEQGKSETFRPIEGTMHVNTSSQTWPPLLDMSVPVEATTQNLMSFANIEEEEE